MPGVVVNMSGIGKLVDEGDYIVTLKGASAKKTRTQKDMVTLQAIIKSDEDGDASPMDGRTLFRNYVIDPDPESDNSGVLFYLSQDLLAFGVDEDDLDSESVDIVALANKQKGSTAKANVTHEPDRDKPEIVRARVTFAPEDL